MKQPTPKSDMLRAMREANFKADQDRAGLKKAMDDAAARVAAGSAKKLKRRRPK